MSDRTHAWTDLTAGWELGVATQTTATAYAGDIVARDTSGETYKARMLIEPHPTAPEPYLYGTPTSVEIERDGRWERVPTAETQQHQHQPNQP